MDKALEASPDTKFLLTCSYLEIYNEARHDLLLTPCYSPLTTHHSPLTTHHSPLTTHHSPLTTHHSPLTIDDSLLHYFTTSLLHYLQGELEIPFEMEDAWLSMREIDEPTNWVLASYDQVSCTGSV